MLSRRGEGEVNERDVSGSPGGLFVTIEVGGFTKVRDGWFS